MKVVYEHNETLRRSYQGFLLEEQECLEHLKGSVKDNLVDREECQDSINRLRALKDETGFAVNDELLADLQELENKEVELQQFRRSEERRVGKECRSWWLSEGE